MYWAYLKVLFKYPPPKGGEEGGEEALYAQDTE